MGLTRELAVCGGFLRAEQKRLKLGRWKSTTKKKGRSRTSWNGLFVARESTRFRYLAKAGFTDLMNNDLHALLDQQFGVCT